MKTCPSYDWMTCPYAKEINDEIYCSLEHPEDDCDDYLYEMEGE